MSETHESRFDGSRREMLEQIAAHAALTAGDTGRGAISERVLDAMAGVPRHEFVPAELRAFAYFDTPLPIGYDKTISQPYIVALMTDLLEVGPGDSVLEIGTGLGYQAAILAQLAARVFSVEIIEELARGAQRRLSEQGCGNVTLKVGDGSVGWPEYGPFDRILVAAAPELIPTSLLVQLKPGGRMVVPAGIAESQQLVLVTKNDRGQLATEEILAVRFSELVIPD